MGRKKSLIPGFSLNRALGVTSAKQRMARATGIPTTKDGRKRKAQRYLWTAAAAGACAAMSKSSTSWKEYDTEAASSTPLKECPYCGQELDEPSAQCPHCGRMLRQNPVKLRKPGVGRILLAVLIACGLLVQISNSIAPKIQKDTSAEGERLSESNVNEYLPEWQQGKESQAAELQRMTDETMTDDSPYYTEAEQAEAAEAYYESIGGNPYADDEQSQVATNDSSEAAASPEAPVEASHTYTLNTSTMVFHAAGCSRAGRIKSENRSTATGTRTEMINMGYSPCGTCKP